MHKPKDTIQHKVHFYASPYSLCVLNNTWSDIQHYQKIMFSADPKAYWDTYLSKYKLIDKYGIPFQSELYPSPSSLRYTVLRYDSSSANAGLRYPRIDTPFEGWSILFSHSMLTAYNKIFTSRITIFFIKFLWICQTT